MRCDEIGIKATKNDFVVFLNGVRSGQFFHVSGYVNQHKEISDYWLRFGIKYPNIKARDIAFLEAVLSGDKQFTLKVKHTVWVPNELLTINRLFTELDDSDVQLTASYDQFTASGVRMPVTLHGQASLMDIFKFTNRKAQERTPVTLSYSLPSTHPLVIAAIGAPDLAGTLLQGLTNPSATPSSTDYEKQAQSCYSFDPGDGSPTKWYLRDVLLVHKKVRKEVELPLKASLPLNAIKEAIAAQHLLTGKYRQFVLTYGEFEAITIDGQSVICDDVNEEFYFALPEDVKAQRERVPQE